MAYLKERVASEEYNKALMARHPLMNATAANMAGQAAISSGLWSPNTGAGLGMSAINNAWPQTPMAPFEPHKDTTRMFTVEKVDNGFVLRSGKYTKICNDMTDLSAQFIAIMVEAQLDK